MEKLETNSSLVTNFFRKNYIKFLCFIFISLIISSILTFAYNKKKESFYSKFQIINNGALHFSTPINLVDATKDFLFYMEKNGYFEKKVLRNRHGSTMIQLEISHRDLNDKGSEQYNKYISLVKSYKERLITKLDTNINIYREKVNKEVTDLGTSSLLSTYEKEFLSYLSRAEELKSLIINDELFFVNYDGVIHSKRANDLILKNAVITLCVNIIIIFLILWIKIFLREMRKNS